MKRLMSWLTGCLMVVVFSVVWNSFAGDGGRDPAPPSSRCAPDIDAVSVTILLDGNPARKITPGSCVTIKSVIRNRNDEAPGTFISEIHLCPKGEAPTAANLWTNFETGVLQKGESSEFLTDLLVIPPTASGDFEVVLVSGLDTADQSLKNNTIRNSFRIEPGDPEGCGSGGMANLIVDDIYNYPTNASRGAWITVTDRTKNLVSLACTSKSRMKLCTTADCTGGTVQDWGTHNVSGLVSNATYAYTSNKLIPSGFPTGTAYIVVTCAESGGCEADGAKTNNVRAEAINIQ